MMSGVGVLFFSPSVDPRASIAGPTHTRYHISCTDVIILVVVYQVPGYTYTAKNPVKVGRLNPQLGKGEGLLRAPTFARLPRFAAMFVIR